MLKILALRTKTTVLLSTGVAMIYYSQVHYLFLTVLLFAPVLYDLMYIANFHRGSWIAWAALAVYSMLGTCVVLEKYPRDALLLAQLVIVVSLSDMLQYILGTKFGRHHIGGPSPNKTWEGYCGALLAGIISMSIVETQHAILWILGGVLGDMYVSYCKRWLGIKDTSLLLGAHGGWLDRMDGIFMALFFEAI